jgi:hypothetical protein
MATESDEDAVTGAERSESQGLDPELSSAVEAEDPDPVEWVDEEDLPETTRGPLDVWEWLMFAGIALLSMAVLGPLLLKGRELSGSDGLFPPDQLQYLTWIRQAGAHWLIGNEFDFRADHRVFLHPGFLISGLVHRWTGASIQLSFWGVWKPVAVLVVFFGCRQYIRRLVPAGWPARVALFIALFAVMPWSALAKQFGAGPQRMYTFDFISGEMWTGQTLLGYMMTAVAVYMVPLVLLGVERARGGGSRWLLALASLGALLIMWLQPWQGAELVIVIIAVELWRRFRHGVKPDFSLVWVCAAAALPAFYYLWLGTFDQSWNLAGQVNRAGAQPLWEWPLWAIALSVGPLAIPAAFALRGKVTGWQSVAVRFWPLAIAIVYLGPFGTFPYHAFQGLTVPLAVLAVQGLTTRRPSWVPRPRAWWVIPALLFLTVPGTLHKLRLVRDNIHHVAYPYYIFDGEKRALRFLEDNPEPGGVLTSTYGGLLVPPHAGREVYIGPFSWTPSWDLRAQVTGVFFADQLGTRAARRFVRSTGAKFVFQECQGRIQPPRSLDRQLGPLIESTHDFGCARVYTLKPNARQERVSSRVGASD